MSLRRAALYATGLFALALAAPVIVSCSDDGGDKQDAAVDGSGDGIADAKITVDAPLGDAASGPKIEQILPKDGFAGSITRVLVKGSGFKAGATAYIDGGSAPGGIIMNVTVSSPVSISFNMPRNPYGKANDAGVYDTPRKVDVAVLVEGKMSNSVSFQYTVSKPMDSTFKGSITTQSAKAYSGFESKPFVGKVYIENLTDTTTGKVASLQAEIGFGTPGTNPSKDNGWKWFTARFSKDDGTYDQYTGSVNVPLSKKYDVAYRFSKDGGLSWVYADTDETDLTYDTTKAASVTATDAPIGYCQKDIHCIAGTPKNPWAVVCKVNLADDTKNTCVECLKDKDCKDATNSLGPYCKTSNNSCYCKVDKECVNNPNGAVCLKGSSRQWCGCKSDKNCKKPMVCNTKAYLCGPPPP